MNKLVLIFNDDSILSNVPKCLVFDNEKDAAEYLLKETGHIKQVEFYGSYFTFKTLSWSGRGDVLSAIKPI